MCIERFKFVAVKVSILGYPTNSIPAKVHMHNDLPKEDCSCVLGLAEMEWTFFIAAHVVLWFDFVTKPVWITQQCFGYSWTVLEQCQGFLWSLFCHPARRLGEGKKLGRDTVRTVDLNWPKGYPYYITSCSAIGRFCHQM